MVHNHTNKLKHHKRRLYSIPLFIEIINDLRLSSVIVNSIRIMCVRPCVHYLQKNTLLPCNDA